VLRFLADHATPALAPWQLPVLDVSAPFAVVAAVYAVVAVVSSLSLPSSCPLPVYLPSQYVAFVVELSAAASASALVWRGLGWEVGLGLGQLADLAQMLMTIPMPIQMQILVPHCG